MAFGNNTIVRLPRSQHRDFVVEPQLNDGRAIIVCHKQDPTLPPAMETGTMLRKALYGVVDTATLALIGAEFERDRSVVRSADGSLEATDDMGRPANVVAVDEEADIRIRSLRRTVFAACRLPGSSLLVSDPDTALHERRRTLHLTPGWTHGVHAGRALDSPAKATSLLGAWTPQVRFELVRELQQPVARIRRNYFCFSTAKNGLRAVRHHR